MINPVTSTRVATKGVDDTAGSAPNFLSSNGSMEPISVPHNTTPIREHPTTSPISTGSDKESVINCQTKIGAKVSGSPEVDAVFYF